MIVHWIFIWLVGNLNQQTIIYRTLNPIQLHETGKRILKHLPDIPNYRKKIFLKLDICISFDFH